MIAIIVSLVQVTSLQQSSWDSEGAAGGRQWTYQTCTEFGWYQSSDVPDSSWGDIIPVSFFENMCKDIFGPKFTLDLLNKGIKVLMLCQCSILTKIYQATNTEYGGLDIAVSNVVFVHGSIDPWHAMGVIQSNRTEAPAIYIEGEIKLIKYILVFTSPHSQARPTAPTCTQPQTQIRRN